MKLVIAEKPSVAQSLAAVIGATARKDGYLMESKFSVYYDSNYLMIDSFEYEVLKNNLIHTKCIEKGNAPASSYHGVISWYNKFNVAGCNVTKVTIGFKVIDPEIDLSNITEILSLHEE